MAFDATAVIIAAGGIAVGLGGGYAAFRKAGPESSQILVDAAKDVVIIQRDAMEELKAGLMESQKTIRSLTAQNERLNSRVKELERDLRELHDELEKERRASSMERRISAEEKRNTDIEAVAREARRREDER
jgi:predicted RNase H-like nuclease (RuvC/YqgF family)